MTAQIAFIVRISFFPPMSCSPLLNMVSHGWEYAYGNDMQMRICIVKLGVVKSINGYLGEEAGINEINVSSADWVF